MAVGNSGRVVIEMHPDEKAKLHKRLKKQGKSLRQWFLEKVDDDFPDLLSEKPQRDEGP